MDLFGLGRLCDQLKTGLDAFEDMASEKNKLQLQYESMVRKYDYFRE